MIRFFTYIKTFLVLIASFVSLSILSCFLPSQTIKSNISKSAQDFLSAGTYPTAIINKKPCQLDNFTDALILNQMFSIDRDSLIYSIIAVPSYMESSPVQSLYKVTQENKTHNNQYSRYWHGSTFFFRPFFLFLDYKGLQEFLYIFSSILFILFVVLFNKKTNWLKTISITVSLALVYGYVTLFSIQFSPVWIISLIASCFILTKKNSPK